MITEKNLEIIKNLYAKYNIVIEADPKMTKCASAYEEYPVKRQCGNCDMYIEGRKCTLVKGDIDPIDGICNAWSFRDTQPIKGKEYKPPLSKEDSGYILEAGGTHCGSCKHMIFPNRCEMVGKNGDEDISAEYGCCMMWEKANLLNVF